MPVISAKRNDGTEITFYMDGYLRKALDVAIQRVKKKNWDYLAIVSGLPGAGKSTLAKTIAKYCCPWFDETYIAFTDDAFIDITTSCPEYSAVVLDESFASLNTKISLTPEFLKIINHIQLIRQRHLFIIFCIPNFFDLTKGIAIFRSSHLFVVYDTEGDRGHFIAFDRDQKKKLYILGSKFIDYHATEANFHGKFALNKDIIDEKIYEDRKKEHLMNQNAFKKTNWEVRTARDDFIWRLYTEKEWSCPEISEFTGLSLRRIDELIAKAKKRA